MRLRFFFELASTTSHPAAMRIESLAAERGVPLTCRPFLLGPIFRGRGWNDSPFNLHSANLHPAKGRTMSRDLERICRTQGIPFRRPSVFPRNGLLAARVCCAEHEAPVDWSACRGEQPETGPPLRDPAAGDDLP